MQNPAFQQMVQSLMSSPEMMDRMTQAVPGLQEMLNTNPRARELLANPEALMRPEVLQPLMQIQQSLQSLQSAGLGPLLNLPQEGGGGGNMGSLIGVPQVSDPETTYANQLQQLQEMGFVDRDANVRALQATGGNVHAAVERLLSQL